MFPALTMELLADQMRAEGDCACCGAGLSTGFPYPCCADPQTEGEHERWCALNEAMTMCNDCRRELGND